MTDANGEIAAPSSGLTTAPDHVKLAVDLIVMLEQNNIDANTALLALELVKADLQKK